MRQDPSSPFWSPVGGVAQVLVGRKQTVPRAEPQALCLAITCSSGPVCYVTDCKSVVSDWHSGRVKSPRDLTGDLW
eukprot:2431512-Pyramimonas_sp.AAC.1